MSFEKFVKVVVAVTVLFIAACDRSDCNETCPEEATAPDAGQTAVDGGTSDADESKDTLCETYGISGQLVAYAKYTTPDDKYLMLSGSVSFPPKAGPIDFTGDICWTSEAGKGVLVCILPNDNHQAAESWPETVVELEPGLAAEAQKPASETLCDANGCKAELLVVLCSGNKEACRLENGEAKDENTELSNDDPQRMVCTVPLL